MRDSQENILVSILLVLLTVSSQKLHERQTHTETRTRENTKELPKPYPVTLALGSALISFLGMLISWTELNISDIYIKISIVL